MFRVQGMASLDLCEAAAQTRETQRRDSLNKGIRDSEGTTQALEKQIFSKSGMFARIATYSCLDENYERCPSGRLDGIARIG